MIPDTVKLKKIVAHLDFIFSMLKSSNFRSVFIYVSKMFFIILFQFSPSGRLPRMRACRASGQARNVAILLRTKARFHLSSRTCSCGTCKRASGWKEKPRPAKTRPKKCLFSSGIVIMHLSDRTHSEKYVHVSEPSPWQPEHLPSTSFAPAQQANSREDSKAFA